MLVDTNVLLRTIQLRHPQHDVATRAIKVLPARGMELHIVAQNLIELWAVATRPADNNGLDMTPTQAAAELERLRAIFVLLPETPAIYPAWEELVLQQQVRGKAAHDARLVAAMQVHGIAELLTFERTGFSRYAAINVVYPADVIEAT